MLRVPSYDGLGCAVWRGTVVEVAEIGRDIGHQQAYVDLACRQDGRRFCIFGQRQQEVLERYETVRLLAGISDRALQRGLQAGTHLDVSERGG